MTKANGKVRGRASSWLRILAGILIVPIIWFGFLLLADAALPPPLRVASRGFAPPVLFIVVGFVGWLMVRKSSTRVAVTLSALALLGYGLVLFSFLAGGPVITSLLPEATPPPLPKVATPAPAGRPPAPVVRPAPPPQGAAPPALPPQGVEPPSRPSTPALPEFPWPPPASSASYVLPDDLFKSRRTVGEVVAAILSALEHNGYVERSFFRTEAGGVALVSRLERINDDGSSYVENERWPASKQNRASTNDLVQFLRGLFFVDPGHYRVIVFILQDLPFSQSSQRITEREAREWLSSGGNVLPPEIAERTFGGGHCTVLVYEFASDGTAVRVVESQLTGKRHLEKAGLLSLLEKVN